MTWPEAVDDVALMALLAFLSWLVFRWLTR